MDSTSIAPSPPLEDRVMRLAKLKKAVEDGTYRISSQNIAGKIIDHLRNVPPKT